MKKATIATISAWIPVLLIPVTVSAQVTGGEGVADYLRQSGSMYAVISVLVTIFAGLVGFLVFQERRISRLEKQLKQKDA